MEYLTAWIDNRDDPVKFTKPKVEFILTPPDNQPHSFVQIEKSIIESFDNGDLPTN